MMNKRRPRKYKCDNCGAINDFTIKYHRDIQNLYTNSLDLPSHYYFGGQYITVHCNKCKEELTPRDEDHPPLKKHGVYSY